MGFIIPVGMRHQTGKSQRLITWRTKGETIPTYIVWEKRFPLAHPCSPYATVHGRDETQEACQIGLTRWGQASLAEPGVARVSRGGRTAQTGAVTVTVLLQAPKQTVIQGGGPRVRGLCHCLDGQQGGDRGRRHDDNDNNNNKKQDLELLGRMAGVASSHRQLDSHVCCQLPPAWAPTPGRCGGDNWRD